MIILEKGKNVSFSYAPAGNQLSIVSFQLIMLL